MKLFIFAVTCLLVQAFQFTISAQAGLAVIDGYVRTKGGEEGRVVSRSYKNKK